MAFPPTDSNADDVGRKPGVGGRSVVAAQSPADAETGRGQREDDGGRAGTARPPPAAALREVAGLFLTLGTIGFGGPAAHLALMEDEVVRRRRWVTRERFLDLVGLANLIPGPNSTEVAIHLGYLRAGPAGLVVAGCCFILPAAAVVGAIAWAYVAYGQLPAVAGLLYGVKPVVLAVVGQAVWRLGRTAVTTPPRAALAVAAGVASAGGANELVVLVGVGALSAVGGGWRRAPAVAAVGTAAWPAAFAAAGGPASGWARPPVSLAAAAAGAAAAGATATAVGPVGAGSLFVVFLKIGSVLFGSGYVLLAFLRADLVRRLGWLTEGQLLDAVAVGQVTPGPVFTTATFIGYVVGGPGGAAAATVGIFLPAFVFVAALIPLAARVRRSAAAGRFLDGLNLASLALMAVAAAQLGRAALVDPLTTAIAGGGLALLLSGRVNSTWVVAAGAGTGLVAALWR